MDTDGRADSGLCPVKIGLIATLTGVNGKIGNGVLSSAEHIRRRQEESLAAHGLTLEIVKSNDHGKAATANKEAKACFEAGCVALIGPCDSISMREIVDNEELRTLPKLCTFATATDLADGRDPAFFRFTHNDRERAEYLVIKLLELLPNTTKVALYTLIDPPESYSQGLRRDVVAALTDQGVDFENRDFATVGPVELPADATMPVVICAPSAEGVDLIGKLRDRRHRGRAFAFGSNTNFRTEKAIGTVIVADLDRHDPNVKVRRVLKAFFKDFRNETEPSIATMTAVEVLVNVLLRHPASAWREPAQARELVVKTLRQGGINGVCGPIGFLPNGEMIGHETISLLKVRKRSGHIDFSPLRGPFLPKPPVPGRFSRAGKVAVGALGLITMITSLLSYLEISLADLALMLQQVTN